MTDYRNMIEELELRISTTTDRTANLANAAAILYNGMNNVNWAGFYMMKEGQLVLGPFQGLPAVTQIQVGTGVCGTAVQTQSIQRVENVHEFCGHIACDLASNAEIVLPIRKNGCIIGVLDIDSPLLGRFTQEDEAALTMFVQKLEAVL